MLGSLIMQARRASLMVLLVGVCWASACAADQDGRYYKWIDAQGSVHYSATPPLERKAAVLHVKEQAPVQGRPLPKALPVQSTDELAKAETAYRQQACAAAKSDIATLEQGRMIVNGSDPDTATRMTPSQREAALAKAKSQVAQFCVIK